MTDTQNMLDTVKATIFQVPENIWSQADAEGLTEEELLLYRSNLLGSDLTITNFGGGNTSAKLEGIDPISSETVEVLWVKGSGGDLGSMRLDGFATLYQQKLLQIEEHYAGPEDDDKMVGYLPHCTYNLNARAASIDTPLHSLLPFKHIDHVHPDAIIALAASTNGESKTREIWGGSVGWLPWKRPGFTLGVQIREFVRNNPETRGVILAGHGLICWAGSSEACYENTVQLIQDAANYLNREIESKPSFGGRRVATNAQRYEAASKLMPRLRGLIGRQSPKIGHLIDNPATLEFVNSAEFERLASIGTSCPDHFLRTKIAPLTLNPEHLENDQYLTEKVEAFRNAYAAYYERCARPGDPAMRDPNPIVTLVPSIGQITFAANKPTARIAGEFYGNAINVMRGAESIGSYMGLDEQEAFNIEYWALEEAKLQRMPKPKPLSGKIAVITGGAGGIGVASARRFLSAGACVVLLDLDDESLVDTNETLASEFGSDFVRSMSCDVTQEDQVRDAFAFCAQEYGGLDILVANAGIASSSSVEDTDLALWNKNYDVLTKGYFLSAKSAFPLMKLQGGGSIVFIGSKNGISAAKNASAYSSAKAAALHLARCLALEGAPQGIRVNSVNPDAVIKGSKIWHGDWRQERASAHGIDPGLGLEEHYRKRSLLNRSVFAEDVAEAVYYFASQLSEKSTGNMINVDAGNAQAFSR